jgi:hypothetical protein
MRTKAGMAPLWSPWLLAPKPANLTFEQAAVVAFTV